MKHYLEINGSRRRIRAAVLPFSILLLMVVLIATPAPNFAYSSNESPNPAELTDQGNSCELYPIALSNTSLEGKNPGDLVANVLNGTKPGNFGWLTWTGKQKVKALSISLTSPGDSYTYLNPNDASDHELNVGDWVRGRPGVSNSKLMRNALDRVKYVEITVPVWDEVLGKRAKALYHITGFAKVRIDGYKLTAKDKISVTYLGEDEECLGGLTHPVANDDTYDVNEDQVLVVPSSGVLANDLDPNDDPLTASLVTETLHGDLVLRPDGSFTYTPAANYFGHDSFTYAASDGQYDSNVARANITVLPVNDPPTATADAYEIDQDKTLDIVAPGVLRNDNDIENDPLNALLESRPVHGTLTLIADGSFTYTPNAGFNGADSFKYVANDGGLNSAPATVNITVREPGQPGLPPDPATVAPPLDLTVATTMAPATEFLYTGQDPIQTGVEPDTINPQRVVVLRGKVMNRDEQPLPGVTITILDHPEFGQTMSRADGMFDIAVNGGGLLTIDYEKEGYLPAQRQVQTPWQDYVWVDDVILIQLDTNVAEIDLSAPIAIQVAQGSEITDEDGTRQATLLIPQGTTAELVLPDGTTQPLTTLHIQATEYTVGDTGPEAMPAELPCQVGYTYAVELSADEAIAAGASDVQFSQPLAFYLENFLDLPVGGIVPAGYYDRERGTWIPSPNGRIIAIVSITGGLADVDTDGDGIADDGAALGITDAERQELAARYAAGQSLWRVPVDHFTPWDYNWPYGPDEDADDPNQPDPDQNGPPTGGPCGQGGSIIECETQTLREEIPIAGTPFTLHYGSDRVAGRTSDYTIRIPLSGDSIPASLKRIELEVSVAGQQFQQTFAALPNQTATFTWDGLDAYGRAIQGRQPISTSIGYVYDAVYMEPAQASQAFASFSGVPISGSRARQEFTLSQEWQGAIGAWDASVSGLGGWIFGEHHAYDVVGKVLYTGNGDQRRAEDIAKDITTVAGNGDYGYSGDGGPATLASLNYPMDVAVGPDNSLYIADVLNHRIRRVGTDGIITTVAGNGVEGYSGDGGPAIQASISGPRGVAVGPDNSIYIADTNNWLIRRVGTDGIITTVAGNGDFGYSGDGGPATLASLASPMDVAVGLDNSLYIMDAGCHCIRRVGPDGIITTVVGSGVPGSNGDGGPATLASLASPRGVATGPDCCLYIADTENGRIRRVGTDGIITTVAGNGVEGYSGDGGPATLASLTNPEGIAVGLDNSLYIVDLDDYRIRRVGPDGIITTVAGNGVYGYGGDGGPATLANLANPAGIEVGPDNSLYIADSGNDRIRRVAPPSEGTSIDEIMIPSEDGQQIYIFDPSGRHLRTLHALTGAILYQFTYDSHGFLATVVDGDGNTTTIERDAGGWPTAIVAPFGQHTELSQDANGYLAAVTNPAGEMAAFTYTAGGLMTTMTDARGKVHTFDYDSAGRLIRDQDPLNGVKTLFLAEINQGYAVTVTSAEGRETIYSMERRPVGGTIRRVTQPDGTQTVMTTGTNGRSTLQLPDGTLIDILEGPDPRFGMQAALPSSYTLSTPDGVVQTITTVRTVTLANPDDIFSLSGLTDQLTVNGRIHTTHYDAANRTYTYTSPEGRIHSTTIDDQGRVVLEQTTGLAPIAYAYDARGRLSTITQGTGAGARNTRFTYNTQGYLQTIVDPLDQTVRFEYDAAGRVTQQILADGRIIAYAYDDNGNLTSLTPPGQPGHAFAYNAVDLAESYNPPGVGLPLDETHLTYDLDRQVTRIALPTGQNLDFSFNPATGNLSSLSFSRGTLSFGYSVSTGLLMSLASPGGISLAFTYDGTLLMQESWSGPVAGSVGRTYDNDLRITVLRVNGGSAIAYQYDADGLLTEAGDLTLERDPQNGLLTGTTLGSVDDSWAYNGFGEPETYAATYEGNPIYDIQYTRDALGRITGKTETIGGVTDVYAYDYDPAGRLLSVEKNGVTVASYTYDSNGNRLSHTSGGNTVTGSYDDQDRLLQYGAGTYTYTADGRLLAKTRGGQTTGYQIDELGNLISVSLPDGTQIAYLVDGNNRRIGRKVNGALVQGWLYQDDLNPIAELDGTGDVVARFIYGSRPNAPDYMVKDGSIYRFIPDHLGSPRLVINIETGEIVQRLDYDEFGRVVLDTNPGFQPFGFAGGLYDAANGLLRFGAREYDPVTGRWLSKDPIWDVGNDANQYAYVGNDPVNWIDPDGKGSMSPMILQSNVSYPPVSTQTMLCSGPDSNTKTTNILKWSWKAVRVMTGRPGPTQVPTFAPNPRG